MFNSQRSTRWRGFTLIELLVVIAVISILAAILFPIFARARENARRTSCLSNLRQMSLAFTQYSQDYDERLPLTSFRKTAEFNNSWTIGAEPYLKSTQIFRCASDSAAVWNAPAAPPTNNYYTTSYLMNAWMAGSNTFTHLASVGSPARVVILSESNGVARDHFHPFFWGSPPETVNPFMNPATWDSAKSETKEFPLARHLEGFNVAFCDGHVKWTKWSGVWPPKSGEAPEGIFDPRNS